MTNDEYFNEIETYFNKLREYREKSKTIAEGIIGENLTEDDIFFSFSTQQTSSTY